MRLWRLSSARHANDFDGGYGRLNDGRWNTRGRPVTYCSTVPSLAALEKRLHVSDPGLLPLQMMVGYDLPDNISSRTVAFADLPEDWPMRETHTQELGNAWLDSAVEVLLIVPSAIVPIAGAPDRNVLINHRAANADTIEIAETIPFTFDPRLFNP
jgi:RES domain-containing protein